MLVRRNLTPHIHRALLCWVELIPPEAQIRAATIQDARTFLLTTAEGEGLHATAEVVYATRTKEEHGGQDGAIWSAILRKNFPKRKMF
jgi:hypothetical protein